MEELDALRIDHANSAIAKGHAGLNSDPCASYYQIWSGRMLLIFTKLRCSGDFPFDDIVALSREAISATSEHGIQLDLEKQNEIIILSLAVGDIVGAREVAQIDCSIVESHGFDIALNRRLRSFFTEGHAETSYNPTKFEQELFTDLDSIASKRDTDLTGIDRYWTSTKTKRYANTAFGIMNIFRPAMEQLKGM